MTSRSSFSRKGQRSLAGFVELVVSPEKRDSRYYVAGQTKSHARLQSLRL